VCRIKNSSFRCSSSLTIGASFMISGRVPRTIASFIVLRGLGVLLVLLLLFGRLGRLV